MKPVCVIFACWLTAGAAWAADASSASAPQAAEFRFAAKAGDVWRTRTTIRTFGSVTLVAPLPPQKFSQTWEQELVMKCLRLNADGTIVFEMSMPNVAMTMNLGGINLTVDTRQPSASSQPAFETIHRIFEKITKVKCAVTFSPRGEPLKVEGLSQGIQGVLEEAKPMLSVPMRKLLDQVRDSLGDQIIEEELRSIFRMVPDGGKARVGDKWARDWQTTMSPFNITTRTRGDYELLGIEELRGHRCAKIRVRTTMQDQTDSKPAGTDSGSRGAMDRVKFSVKSSGGEGTAYLDYATGQMVQLRETQRAVTEASITPDPSKPQGGIKEGMGSMTQTFTTSIRIDLLDGAAEGDSAAQRTPASTPAN